MNKRLEQLDAYKKLETEIVYTLTWIDLVNLSNQIKFLNH